MSPVLVILVLTGLVATATAVGLVWRARQGRIVRAGTSPRVRAVDLPGVRRLAAGATLVQFSSQWCAPCTTTRGTLAEVAQGFGTVAHVELDVARHPELVQRYRVRQTPTTLIVDDRGIVHARIGGAPRADDVHRELARLVAP